MEIIYSGKEVKRLLNESIPNYKPVIGGNSAEESKKINVKSNKDSLSSVKTGKIGNETKPKIGIGKQSSDIGNNKNMLDVRFDEEPSKEYKERVKKQVTGEDSEFGNKVDKTTDSGSNSMFYKAAKKAASDYVDKKQKLSNSGINGKNLPVEKKTTPFNENKTKRLNFKKTRFLSERHMFSLIPEEYKNNGNTFIMKDSIGEEYLIEWRNDAKTGLSEGIILKRENKGKIVEEFDRIKQLYNYSSKKEIGQLNNNQRLNEEKNVSKYITKLNKINDI